MMNKVNDAIDPHNAQTLAGQTPAWQPSLAGPEGASGTSLGINLLPGNLDDGWVVPPHVALEDGTTLQLYKDGEALHAAFEAIRSAKRRICLEVYIFRSDATGLAFADLLCQKAREGLFVYVIYDSFGSMQSDPAMFRRMKAAGVRLAAFHPIKPWECKFSWRPFNRDHRKLLIIDDEIAGLGGLNVGGEYAGSWVVRMPRGSAAWRDNAIGLRGPAVELLLRIFVKMWRYIQHGGRMRNAEFLHNTEEGDFGVLASTPSRRSPLSSLRHMLREAHKSIFLTMSYFAPPDELIDDLCRAARRRVRVRLMLAGMSDVKILLTAARSFYEKLLTSGAEVYERQGAILHAKSLCIDESTTIIGSTNLDCRSIDYNCEISVIVRNATFGHQMHDLFENDIRYAQQIMLKEWRHRPVADRFVQWAVMRARYLM
jgi:cardiolipin synthase